MANGMEMSIRLEGADDVERSLNKLGLELKDMRGALWETGNRLIPFFSGQVFASRGQVIGQRWPRLNAGYAVRKAQLHPGAPMLVRTGEMQRSFTKQVHGQDTLEISNSAPHFVYHQSTAPRSKIPRRAMLAINQRVQRDVINIISKNLSKKVEKNMNGAGV